MKSPILPKLNSSISEVPFEHTKKIWQQFQRDLAKIGHENSKVSPTDLSVNQLLTKINEVLSVFAFGKIERFWQLLYVVDLPEIYLTKIDFTDQGIEECSKIVLLREYQKVILRLHFSAS